MGNGILFIVLFIVLAIVAIGAALGMLVSRNAVYSALFLILNFATMSVFYILLNAPFLAMVQVTVYAGAIMVLFLFVIMLLGAE
ncbi:MAG: NADH-quinone oxidoreductase subunit J, partial [Anaerolineales bacterium]|nr:NADH-quinone oxidoreductase subunit J [Anaerolineales bacterium]